MGRLQNSAKVRTQHKISISLNSEVFAQCRRVPKWKTLISGIAVHAAIFTLSALAWQSENIIIWLFVFSIIGAFQLHLSILLHDGAHHLAYPSKKENDLASNLLFAIPLLTTVRNYRTLHLDHHQFSGHPELDLEHILYKGQNYFYFPQQNVRSFLKRLFLDICAWNSLQYFKSNSDYLKSKPNYKLMTSFEALLTIGFWMAVGVVAWTCGVLIPFLIFWFGPLLTFTFLFLKMHGYGEHTGALGPTEFNRTYTHQPHLIRDFFLYPFNSGLHLQHHLYASVPWYKLKLLKNELELHSAYREMLETN